jgi:hypothetical protein
MRAFVQRLGRVWDGHAHLIAGVVFAVAVLVVWGALRPTVKAHPGDAANDPRVVKALQAAIVDLKPRMQGCFEGDPAARFPERQYFDLVLQVEGAAHLGKIRSVRPSTAWPAKMLASEARCITAALETARFRVQREFSTSMTYPMCLGPRPN